MESQSPETTDAPEFTTELFKAAPTVGRPPSSTSTSAPPTSSTSESPNQSPGESSTSPDPNSWTEPRHDTAPDPGASPAGSSPSEPAAPSSLRETIADTLTAATTIAHNSLTDDIGRAHHLYLATEGEVTTIAESGASILTRRLGPVLGGSSELVDVVSIVMAVGSYATRTFQAWKSARAARAQVHEQTQQQPASV